MLGNGALCGLDHARGHQAKQRLGLHLPRLWAMGCFAVFRLVVCLGWRRLH